MKLFDVSSRLVPWILAIPFVVGIAAAQSQSGGPGIWTKKAPVPRPWTELTGGAVNGKFYAISTDFPKVGGLDEYDPAADTWRARASMPVGIDHLGVVDLNGKLYIVGGFTARRHVGVTDIVYEYNPATDTWRNLASLPRARGSVSAAVFEGKIHAFGGRKNEDDVVSDHDVYDPATNTWTSAPPLSRGRDHMAAVTVDGKIHVVGGRYGANEDMSGLHEIFDPKTSSWTTAAPMPTPRGGGGGALFKGMIVYLGGEDDKRTYDENEGFDLKANRWVTLKPMPTGRHGIGVAAVGNSLYVVGGGQGRGNRGGTDDLLMFTIP